MCIRGTISMGNENQESRKMLHTSETGKTAHRARNAGEVRIAVLSGKGGTGKTFASVNLAASAEAVFAPVVSTAAESQAATATDRMVARKGGTGEGNENAHDMPRHPFRYMDCDVEEPNGHLFLKPEAVCTEPVSVMAPAYDVSLCDGCRICTNFCRFNALAFVRDHVKIFPELCHGCNGCVLLCPTGAMTESARIIGEVACGHSEGVDVLTGTLNPGEATGVPVIQSLVNMLNRHPATVTVLDSPPGSGCAVMECVRESDFCVLVAEPTAFGLHDMGMVAELVRLMGKPAGLLFNRCTEDTASLARETAAREGIPLLGVLPFDSALAGLLAEGGVAVRELPVWREHFETIWRRIRAEVTA